MKKEKDFEKKLVKLIAKEVGCNIQYGGCPCNTCFHAWAQDDLKLPMEMAHAFWLIILGLRGDASKKEIQESFNSQYKMFD